jgi:hypothetical protein
MIFFVKKRRNVEERFEVGMMFGNNKVEGSENGIF